MNQTENKNSEVVHRYLLRELAVPVSAQEADLFSEVAAFLRVKKSRIKNLRIIRKSLDSRRRNNPLWRYTVEIDFQNIFKHPKLISVPTHAVNESAAEIKLPRAMEKSQHQLSGNRVAVIGSGPAGLSAALGFARKGYQVTVYEQGSDVTGRFRDIRQFVKGDKFNPHSNILFGEGGAGTFSDGKLTCRTRNEFTDLFLKELVASGADEKILYLSHPHIGTDQLQFVIKGFRKRCEEAGCVFRFNTVVTDFIIEKTKAENTLAHPLKPDSIRINKITGLIVNEKAENFDAVILAAGHSSQPLYQRLKANHVAMIRKPFSVGVRVEHPQDMVNKRQLGENVDTHLTGAAEYYLTYNSPGESMGLCGYSFCMCPGGVVVPCADAEDGLFTNGMSYSNRAGAFANSAVVVPVTPEELSGQDILAGVEFIRDLEMKAFSMGGGAFTFPAQTILAYMENRLDQGPIPKTSFTKPLTWANFRELFNAKIALALQESFRHFDQKMPGFIAHGFIIGPESRTSSPVRILRDSESLESTSTEGLFPLGEGAGYSGGIVSSGADGFRLAQVFASVAQNSYAG